MNRFPLFMLLLANATKRRRTWAGYAVGAGLQVLVLVLVLGVMLGGVKL